jgi:hypothetical protein
MYHKEDPLSILKETGQNQNKFGSDPNDFEINQIHQKTEQDLRPLYIINS